MIASDSLYDVLRLAEDLRPAWDGLSAAIPAWHPRNEGEEGEGEGEPDADKAAAAAAAKGGEGNGEGEREGEGKPAGGEEDKTDWKAMSRKHERAAKKAAAERDAHAAKLAEIEASNLSENEKALAKAREEARAEGKAEGEQGRRADRIEAAVTKIAAVKGVTIGEGDKAKTVKFADPDDVEMWLERQVAKGEIDGDELYADGKVNDEVLIEALTALAASKPGWLVGAPAGATSGTPAGDADAGKGSGPKGGSSVETELAAIQKNNKR